MNRMLLRILSASLALALALPCAGARAATITDLSTALPTAIPAPEGTTLADETPLAEDITHECLLNGTIDNQHMNQMRDGNHRSVWESGLNGGVHQLLIAPPEGKQVGGMLIRWRSYNPVPLRIQVRDAEGQWQTVATGAGDFVAQYIPLPDIGEEFRIIGLESDSVPLKICEITLLTPGRVPDNVQVWQKPPEKVDMMLLAGHPDDELLWFGGLLPTYGGEQKKDVLVVCAAFRNYHRRLEMLDGLWECGLRIHPIFIGLEDLISSNINEVYNLWGRSRAAAMVATLYRRYHPDVVMLQDVNGEYGHGVHKAFSDAGRRAVALAANPDFEVQEARSIGTWDVPKVYVHLWKEDQVQMDWHVPLEAFGGETSQDVARRAFLCHVTQQGHWKVEDGGEWDNSLFGLYHSTVGPDELKNDLFEHIE